MSAIPPEVLWAQRSSDKDASKNIIFLKVRVVDPANLKIDLEETTLDLSADTDENNYKLHIDLYAEIDTKASHYHVTGSHVGFILVKKKLATEYWPRLTKEKVKYHYIHTDFEKWVDEDEQEDEPEDNPMPGMEDNPDLAKLAAQYGGGGAGGAQFPGMGA